MELPSKPYSWQNLQNPNAGLQTYCARDAQVHTQFAPLRLGGVSWYNGYLSFEVEFEAELIFMKIET